MKRYFGTAVLVLARDRYCECWTQKGPLWSWLGTGYCMALIRGRCDERLDKPQLRTGGNRDLSGPLWWGIARR